MNKSCAHCGGPTPERISPLGRPPIYCTITCRRDADHLRTSRRLEEERRAATELRAAEAARAHEADGGGPRRRRHAALAQLQADAWMRTAAAGSNPATRTSAYVE